MEIADLVIADMVDRKRLGLERYGKPLTVAAVMDDGRDPLEEAYLEVLDEAVYLKLAILERDSLRAELADAHRMIVLLAERVNVCSQLLAKRAERR